MVTLFLSCHFQLFQSSGAVSDQYPGARETKSFPSPFPEAKVFIFVVDEKVKTLKYRVNAGTLPCATHVNERFEKGDVTRRPQVSSAQTGFSIDSSCRFQQKRILSMSRKQRQAHRYAVGVGDWERHLRQATHPCNACQR